MRQKTKGHRNHPPITSTGWRKESEEEEGAWCTEEDAQTEEYHPPITNNQPHEEKTPHGKKEEDAVQRRPWKKWIRSDQAAKGS
eukprot:9326769-Ditylum_brightwellii.AAC.1